MIRLKDLLVDRRIKIVVEEEDYHDFLDYVKKEGCIWDDGSVINSAKDKSYLASKTFIITNDLLISKMIYWQQGYSLQNAPRYLYKDIKEEKVIDEQKLELNRRIVSKNNNYELERKAKEFKRERKIEENHKISLIQIKYKNVTNKLQKYFFVHYENDDELLKLFPLLKEHGYENKYDIDLDHFSHDPRVICVNNEDMIFHPAEMIDCHLGLISKHKIYQYHHFKKMITKIFGY